MIKAGTIIEGPLDQAYEVTADLHAHQSPTADCFRAIGNAPTPMNGMLMPYWLIQYLGTHFTAEARDRG